MNRLCFVFLTFLVLAAGCTSVGSNNDVYPTPGNPVFLTAKDFTLPEVKEAWESRTFGDMVGKQGNKYILYCYEFRGKSRLKYKGFVITPTPANHSVSLYLEKAWKTHYIGKFMDKYRHSHWIKETWKKYKKTHPDASLEKDGPRWWNTGEWRKYY